MVRISYDRRFEFGKYKGFSVMEVIYKDPQYVEYISSRLRWLFTDREIQTLRNLRHKQKNKDIHITIMPMYIDGAEDRKNLQLKWTSLNTDDFCKLPTE